MLNARAQGQFQAIAQATQAHGKGAVAVNSGVSATNQFFLGAPVVHGKGIEVDRGVATGETTEVDRFAIDAATQQQSVHLGSKQGQTRKKRWHPDAGAALDSKERRQAPKRA